MVIWFVINNSGIGDQYPITWANVKFLLPNKCVTIFLLLFSESLFDAYDKEVSKFVMSTLKPTQEVEMNVINGLSSILNDLERKRDPSTPSGLFMSCVQCVSPS